MATPSSSRRSEIRKFSDTGALAATSCVVETKPKPLWRMVSAPAMEVGSVSRGVPALLITHLVVHRSCDGFSEISSPGQTFRFQTKGRHRLDAGEKR
jgi:hypothetical protein